MAGHKQTTDVVYPYKYTISNELDFSIKSLKNIEYDQVLVMSDYAGSFGGKAAKFVHTSKPLWASYSSSHDQIAKYYHACKVSTAERLILMNDDFFIMQPWEPQNYNRGTLADHLAERGRTDNYTRQLISTGKYLLSKDLTLTSFELHVPMVVDRLKLKQAIEELIPHISKYRSNVVLIRSYYGNRFRIESTVMPDCKNPKDFQGLPFISTSDKTFRGELGDYIKASL
jgi:hypothetical protein